MGNNNRKARTFLLELAKCGENALRRLKPTGLTSSGHCSGWDPATTDDTCTDNISDCASSWSPTPAPQPATSRLQAGWGWSKLCFAFWKGAGELGSTRRKEKRLSESSSPLQGSQLNAASILPLGGEASGTGSPFLWESRWRCQRDEKCSFWEGNLPSEGRLWKGWSPGFTFLQWYKSWFWGVVTKDCATGWENQ